jgi:leucyl/phenylalanyl-tRNA--protein transferase
LILIKPLYNNSYEFPPVQNATEDGLLAYGGDLNPERVMLGYRQGIFPWFDDRDPILWWSPNPRFILGINDLKVSKSLQRTIKKNIFQIRYDTAFVQVMIECANAPRNDQEGTWIVPEMIECYSELHSCGIAHSFEAWLDGELVGGGYGVVVGDIFCGESMFTKVSDASKVAFVHLVKRLKNNGFRLIDSQVYTEHLERFGAKHISREKYLEHLSIANSITKIF